MVFDKTGTLTEDGLQVYGYRSLKGPDVSNLVDQPNAHPAVDFDRFHENIEYLTAEEHTADWW